MNPKRHFMTGTLKETSKLFRPFFLFTFLPILGILTFLLIAGIQKRTLSDIIICSVFVVLNLAVLVILQLPKLYLIMSEAGVTFRYRPFNKNYITYSWEQVQAARVITFDPVAEFKGWGKKYSKKYGTGYLTRGGQALYLQLKDGRKVTVTVADRDKAMAIIPASIISKA